MILQGMIQLSHENVLIVIMKPFDKVVNPSIVFDKKSQNPGKCFLFILTVIKIF